MSAWAACWLVAGSALASLAAFLAWLWLSRPRTNAPGPKPLPLLGNLPQFWRKLPVEVNDFRELHRRYGDVFRLYIGPKLILVATQPDDAKRLLVGCKMRERDDYVTRALVPFTGYGLIVNKGNLWKTHRKLIEPTFHTEVLHSYTEAFNKGAQFLCSRLAEADGAEVEISKILLHTSFHFLTLSIFGTSFDDLEPDRNKQVESVDVFISGLELIQKRFYQPWLQIDWIISLTPDGEALKRQMKLFNGLAKHGIALLRERRSKSPSSNGKRSFVDVMMDDRGNFLLSESEVYDEVRTFSLAGTDTTATALSFVFAMLGLHPEWQDAIQKEVDEVFGTGDDYLRPTTDSDLVQLKVTEAVIKETLRLFPAVPVAPVVASEDIPLGGGRYVAPRGSVVFVFLNLLHRQPAIYADPDRFDPGRFLEGGDGGLPPYSYLPFGAGSRVCVGARYAMLVMKTVLATVMRQFRVLSGSTREELERIAVFVTGKPVHGIRITCVPRPAPGAKYNA